MSWSDEKKTERRRDRSSIPTEAAKKQLEYIVRLGEMEAALLATEDGLAVVHTDAENTESFAVLAGFLWSVSKQIEDISELNEIDQIALTDPTGRTILCRFFDLLGQPVVLGIICGEIDASTRALTERAISGLRRIFAEHGGMALQGVQDFEQ